MITTTLPNQRVSNAERNKESWYKPTINFIIDKAISINSKSKAELNDNLLAAEGMLTSENYKKLLEPYGITDTANILPTLKDISLILPIKRRYMGEYIRQFKDFQVFHKDNQIALQHNKELSKVLNTMMLQEVMNKTIEMGAAEGQKQEVPQDKEQFAKEYIDKYMDDETVKSQNILNLIKHLTDSDIQYTKGFNYWWATEEFYTYRSVNGTDLIKDVIHPSEYYRIPTDNIFVEDDDMGMRKYQLTFNQMNERFDKILTEKQLNYLKDLNNLFVNPTNVAPDILTSRVIDLHKISFGVNNAINYNMEATSDLSRFCEIHHVVFKSEVKIGILSYIDTLSGQLAETIVDETYKIDYEALDVSIEWLWISRVFEAERIGPKELGIYTKPRLVQPQRQDVNVKSKCKLPYNGITGTFNNNLRTPLTKILMPYEALYKIFYYHREKAIAKYRPGLYIIPDSVIQNSKHLTMEQRMTFSKRDDTLYINDNASANSLQALRFIGNQGAEKYIQVLTETLNQIKQDALEVADMNQQRYGDINQSAGKGITDQAINRASTGSILLFTLFNKCAERDFEADIDFAKVAWIDGKQGAYYDAKAGKVVYVEIDGYDLYNRNIGIFVGNAAVNSEKIAQYRNFAFSAAQNGDFDIAADSIEGENSIVLHRVIKKAMEAKRQHETQLNERQAQATEKAGQDVLLNGREQRAHEKESWNAEYIKATDVAKINAGASIQQKQMDIESKETITDKELTAQQAANEVGTE